MDRIWQKTKQQAKRIDIFIMTSELVVLIVALGVLYAAAVEQSWAVAAIGLWFLGFAAWHFYSY